MEHKNVTAQAFSSDDARKRIKQIWALAIASFPDVNYEKVATWLDESATTIKFWCNPKMAHCPPAWALIRLHECHTGMAHYIDVQMEVMRRTGDHAPVAHSLEAQMNALIGATAKMLSVDSEARTGDNHYDAQEAQRQVATLTSLREMTDRAIARAQERAGVVALRRAQ